MLNLSATQWHQFSTVLPGDCKFFAKIFATTKIFQENLRGNKKQLNFAKNFRTFFAKIFKTTKVFAKI
jgi:hypothetical protein